MCAPRNMIYSTSLETALILSGIILIALCSVALWRGAAAQASLRAFPRSRTAGFILLIVAAIWSWLLIKTIDLGEFSNWRDAAADLHPRRGVADVDVRGGVSRRAGAGDGGAARRGAAAGSGVDAAGNGPACCS